MNILDRVTSPTPAFFTKLRNIGLVLAAISTAIIGAPVTLPDLVIKIAGYVAVAGCVMSAVSQATIRTDH